MTETIQEVTDEAQDKAQDVTGNGGGDLGKKILIPAAAGLGTLAATYAVRKVPELLNDKVKPKLEEKGGEQAAKLGEQAGQQAAQKLKSEGGPLGKIAGKAAEKFSGGGGGGGGGKKTRRLPIQRWTDIAAPIDVVYDKWTNFEEFPKFMHRVLTIEKKDRNILSWEEKIWFSKRQWEGEITERKKNDRLAWKTKKGTSHKGVISFHKLDTSLTRVMVDMDFQPTGMIEKMGSGMRFVKRAVQADLARFKAHVELGEAKGLDYTQDSTTQGGSDSDDKEKDDKKDDKKDEASGSNGQAGAKAAGSDDKSEDERESEREERSQRREQRRA
jgi:polyketide cyclase/dehydrase/lipid transport protein